jgi:protein phosphatase
MIPDGVNDYCYSQLYVVLVYYLMLQFRAYGKSDRGLKRSNNEDSFVILPRSGLLAVADGMGGAASGEVASRIFSETVAALFSDGAPESEEDLLERVRQVYLTSNSLILTTARQDRRHSGMGCTADLLVLYDNRFVVAHVGDSRTFLHRNGVLRQITRDHSLVQQQVDQGRLSDREARISGDRNIILRAVGVEDTLAVDLFRGEIYPGDIFLVCSDGLTDMVDPDAITRALDNRTSLEVMGNHLIASALSAGGSDNVTIALAQVV